MRPRPRDAPTPTIAPIASASAVHEVAICRAEVLAGAGHDEQHAPRSVGARDRRGDLRPVAGEDRQRDAIGLSTSDGRRPGRLAEGALLSSTRGVRGASEDAERPRKIEQAGRRHARRHGHGLRDEPIAAALPDDDQGAIAGVADLVGDPLQVVLERGHTECAAGDGIDEGEVAPMTLGVLGGQRRIEVDPGRGGPSEPFRPDRRDRRGPTRRREKPSAIPGANGACLGGREEPLQVAEPIASIAARIDPVVAQTARVAPRTDRVRMHAEHSRGLRDGECRVNGSRRQLGGHAQWKNCEVHDPEANKLTVLDI